MHGDSRSSMLPVILPADHLRKSLWPAPSIQTACCSDGQEKRLPSASSWDDWLARWQAAAVSAAHDREGFFQLLDPAGSQDLAPAELD